MLYAVLISFKTSYTMKAIKIIEGKEGQTAELQDMSVPALRDDYVLCKVNCVALNPTDWLVMTYPGSCHTLSHCSCSAFRKHIDGDGGIPGSSVGSDFCESTVAIIVSIRTLTFNRWRR